MSAIETIVDPVVTMAAEHERMIAASAEVARTYEAIVEENRSGRGTGEDRLTALDDQLDVMNAAEDALEDRIVQTVATSLSGLSAQMRILARFVKGEHAETIAKTVIAGLDAMQGRAGHERQ
jgi:hypothetical protein